MATLYLLADEPVKNQQQQDCHLVAIIYAPDGSDSGALRKEAENKIKEEVDRKFALGERFALRFTDKNTASEYLRADPGACWHSYSKNQSISHPIGIIRLVMKNDGGIFDQLKTKEARYESCS